jgi:cell wall-associated NlpC family hydrolase
MVKKITSLKIHRAFAAIATIAAALIFIVSASNIVVSAAQTASPVLSVYAVFADRIAISVDNRADFSENTQFEISVSGKYLKTVSRDSSGVINIYGGSRYLKASTNYTVTVTAVSDGESSSSSIKVKTDSVTYFKLAKGTALYTLSGGSMKAKSSAAKKSYVSGALVSANGSAIAGKAVSSCTGKYVKITSGDYKGLYVSAADVSRSKKQTAQRSIVSDYGASMNGGSYVSGGTQFKRTDCSGLTMQSYAQIGVSISHSVALQSRLGKSVSVNNMQQGDLIIMNGKSHVAMYIGNGQMVHAMNPSKGIRVEPISKLQYYKIDSVRRIIQ